MQVYSNYSKHYQLGGYHDSNAGLLKTEKNLSLFRGRG